MRTIQPHPQQEMIDMDIEDIERERTASGWTPRPGSDRPISEEEIQANIKRTAQSMDKNLRKELTRGCCGIAQCPTDQEEEVNRYQSPMDSAALGPDWEHW
jgi:hypothetical protein